MRFDWNLVIKSKKSSSSSNSPDLLCAGEDINGESIDARPAAAAAAAFFFAAWFPRTSGVIFSRSIFSMERRRLAASTADVALPAIPFVSALLPPPSAFDNSAMLSWAVAWPILSPVALLIARCLLAYW